MNPHSSVTVFENPDDQKFLAKLAIVTPERTRLIRGAGVNVDEFTPSDEPAGIPTVALPARMLWDIETEKRVRTMRLRNLSSS